jgi:hypothetical protein
MDCYHPMKQAGKICLDKDLRGGDDDRAEDLLLLLGKAQGGEDRKLSSG